MKTNLLILALVLALSLMAFGLALAQGTAVIDWWVFGSGGGPVGDGDGIALNATLGQPVIGVSSDDSISLEAGYWHGSGPGYDETQCDLSPKSTYHYDETYPVTVRVDTLGSIDCIRVQRYDQDHAHATSGLQTGCYWTITATDSSGDPATDFELTLTLPAPFTPDGDDKLCRYTGSAQVWDCGASSFDAGNKTITRSGIIQLSDWAVSDCTDAVTPSNMSISLSGADVTLSWDLDPANTGGYEVHRSTSPYFAPDSGSLLTTEPAGSSSYTDVSAAGSAGENYTYIVRGLSNCGAPSGYEKRLGEFDFVLVPGNE